MSDTPSRTQPVFTVHTALAVRVGLEAAVLYEFVQALHDLRDLSAERGVEAAEDQWLAWTPFLSPASFMTAVDNLAAANLLSCHEDRSTGMLTLLPHRQDTAEHETPYEPTNTSAAIATPPAQHSLPGRHHTRQRVDHSAQPSVDDNWAEFDMPPPMPAISPLLTDHTTVLDTYQQPRPRYSDEPLYAMQRTEPSRAEEPGADGNTAPNQRENSYMHLAWQPSDDCTQMIRNKGIELAFALAQRESFVLYYRDSGQRNMSWDTKFFNWVTRRWQYHLNDQNNEQRNTSQQPQSDESTARQRKQKLRAKLRDIGDLDW
ncbi:MAG: DnaT-like ssDNA-binding domain-containing protein [Natronospirillum sp.]